MNVPEILVKRAQILEDYYKAHYPALAPLVSQCFLNTMETTVKELEDGSYFVITGDIPAMWLRDSTAQVRPYVKYAKEDLGLQKILEGIIAKQAELVCIDPYANAFNESANGAGAKDDTLLNDHVWERKYEVDSLCAPIYLGYLYWKTTGINRIFTQTYHAMVTAIVDTFTVEQDHRKSDYSFQRYDCVKTDTLPCKGKGRPVNVTGMTWSGFRPSDDSCSFGYLVPANMMAVMAMEYAKEICLECYQDKALADRCSQLGEEIQDGIMEYAIVEHPKYGKIYSYETDGFGNYKLMDDANSPSLLAMPYLGYCDREDALYQNTRRFILSMDNPYYYEGSLAKGMGSPHTPEGYVWHIGIVMQALTSGSREEILSCLAMLSRTHAGTNYMHESFEPSKPEEYTRAWFAWANTLFAELLDRLMEEDFFASK
ncbi:glycoside hydrolase family 125 protein [Parablautia muri]|uniref:Glycoside hydrolase family 125 protein n=1 Tax=Parablautia muri TaxID=2320879 RepID=A0A9X5BHG9_9FIRM|nr:glycoside hydrolase family 125 protein [Parablautia muri]NBJ93861.1 glycoside hydrolase family 125 protein [Parablautia muri]